MPLGAAISGLSVEIEYFAEWRAGFALDLAVEFDERRTKPLRRKRAERRFAGAAQADERDAPTPFAVDRATKGAGENLPRLGEFFR